MRLYILLGQRKQQYAGEYAPEALQIVPVTISMDELKKRLIPVDSAIAGQLA